RTTADGEGPGATRTRARGHDPRAPLIRPSAAARPRPSNELRCEIAAMPSRQGKSQTDRASRARASARSCRSASRASGAPSPSRSPRSASRPPPSRRRAGSRSRPEPRPARRLMPPAGGRGAGADELLPAGEREEEDEAAEEGERDREEPRGQPESARSRAADTLLARARPRG